MKTFNDMTWPKAGWHVQRYSFYSFLRPRYWRLANAGRIEWLRYAVTFPLPWNLAAVYNKGHESGWSVGYEAGIQRGRELERPLWYQLYAERGDKLEAAEARVQALEADLEKLGSPR